MAAKQIWAKALSIALIASPMAVAATLGGCNGARNDNNLDSLDAELADRNNAANARDPAVVNALQDEIMVDPQLAQQANHDAIRPPAKPYTAPVAPDTAAGSGRGAAVDPAQLRHAPAADGKAGCPDCRASKGAMTLGALAQRQRNRRTADCAANVQYSTSWATRLSPDVPLYPDARVTEAAGAASNGCALRIVSFSSAAQVQTVIDWYYTRVTKAGYTAEHQIDGAQHVLGGTRNRDGGAYVLYVTRREDGGSDVDLVSNGGN